MEMFQMEDRFLPILMRIYQAGYLMEEIMDYGTIYLPKGTDIQRFNAYTALLYDVLQDIVDAAQAFASALEGETE